MYNLPPPPNTLITHQLECICCRHNFPVAEGPSSGRIRDGESHALTHYHPDTHRHIYYVESGPTGPFHDMYVDQLQPGHESHRESEETTPLFCPRCGADNRNWLYLSRKPQRAIIGQTHKYQLAGASLLLGMVLLVRFVLDPSPERQVRTGIFLISIILVAVLTLFLVPNQWRAVREHRYFIRVVPPRLLLDGISPAVKTAVTIGLILVLGIPLLLYLIMPFAVQTGKSILILDPRGDAIQQMDKLTQKLPAYIDTHPDDVRTIVGSIQSVAAQLDLAEADSPPSPDQVSAQREVWIMTILDKARAAVYEDELSDTELIELNDRLEPAYNLVMGIKTSGTFENINFLSTWFKFVGLTSVLASIIAVAAANHLDRAYDRHLPRPIYHNTSDMTRVARWEMDHALRAKELVQRVQWTQVVRNQNGGISMTGTFRDKPESPKAETVRAQQYTVETDRWCRIANANITDLRTPPPPEGNSYGWVRDVQRVPRDSSQGGGSNLVGDGGTTPQSGRSILLNGGNSSARDGNNTSRNESSSQNSTSSTNRIYIPLPSSSSSRPRR